jgi:hypothetical protein
MPWTANLTGRVFGRWTVLGRAPRVPGQRETWRCRCACGTERDIPGWRLWHGKTRSCGCLARDILRQKRPWRRRNLRGQVIGELTVLRPGPDLPARAGTTRSEHGHTAWQCQCACGRVVLIPTGQLTHQRPTTHCGCRHLKPALEPSPAPQTRPEAPPVVERPTTGQQVLDRLHDERFGGRVSRPVVDESNVGGTLCDGDPFLD